jgi:hypothetical protein
VLITESVLKLVLRFYCNVATWLESVNAKDVVAVVTPLVESPRDGKLNILSEKLFYAQNRFEMFGSHE